MTMARIRYSVRFVHRVTGECRTITVDLSQWEVADVNYQAAAKRRAVEDGWPPLERAYALRRAANGLAAGFEPVLEDMHRVPALELMH
jgi:hypothetical protein